MERDSVNAVKTGQRKGDDKPRKCYNCGREGIWPLIGAVPQKERNVQSVGGMVILLCVVRERVIISNWR